ncbi:MAG: hypothetical protein Unbinned5607contig1000_40 [Prokaryotic dsDNA virus sp.]|nr:MAG: hypothetical protein Unbinned5607contig1000_40 [Prokaryotic dsDNA virus sp.]|tara:strand:+ start:18581 stop:18721 length:141 start_codon:yes stop_codon:yes gene_type:complete
MPLPKPNGGEKQSDFMARCVNSEVVKNEFKNKSQAVAVCYNQWKEK